MGRKYSLNGYLVAVNQRSSKTILVEGITDKSLIQRLIANRPASERINYCIDQPDLFDDPQLSGTGAKHKVLAVELKAQEHSVNLPSLESRLAYLVDREWDGLSTQMPELLDDWYPPDQNNKKFITLGHSVENYYFVLDFVLSYLKHGFCEIYSSEFEHELISSFSQMVALAAAYSHLSKERSIINRISGLLSFSHVFRNDQGSYLIGASFADALASRGVDNAQEFVDVINEKIEDTWSHAASNPNLRWLLHGHLGSEALWACVGSAVLTSIGCSIVANKICHGHKIEMQRYWFSWLSEQEPIKRQPLEEALNWLLSP